MPRVIVKMNLIKMVNMIQTTRMNYMMKAIAMMNMI